MACRRRCGAAVSRHPYITLAPYQGQRQNIGRSTKPLRDIARRAAHAARQSLAQGRPWRTMPAEGDCPAGASHAMMPCPRMGVKFESLGGRS